MAKEPTIAKERTIYSHDGHRLSPREDLFIDKFLELGVAQRAYEEAGYKKVKNTNINANRLLNKNYIQTEIKFRRNERYKKNIATAEEVMDYFTKVMRGEIQDQFGLEAPLSERTKAAQEIAKRTIDIDNRLAGKTDNANAEVKIILDWARPENEAQESETSENK